MCGGGILGRYFGKDKRVVRLALIPAAHMANATCRLVFLKKLEALLDGRWHRRAVIALHWDRFDIQSSPFGQLRRPLTHRLKMRLLGPIVKPGRALETCRIRQRRAELQLAQIGNIYGYVALGILGVLAKKDLIGHGGE